MNLSLGFSPCPNDTFIFDALVHGKIDTRAFHFDCQLEDVETLNQWALEGKLDITKLSFSTYFKVQNDYQLLNAGSALGHGVGPILITNKNHEFNTDEARRTFLKNGSIAIPGEQTTANLLLGLFCPEATNKKVFVFNEIEKAVSEGQADAGLLIHEGRFTYQKKGLHLLRDLGDWWEETYRLPLPLGGIVIKKSLGEHVKKTMEDFIRNSLKYSWARYPQLSDFIKTNAQEMEEDVMRKHIELYVNDYSLDLGTLGWEAIKRLDV